MCLQTLIPPGRYDSNFDSIQGRIQDLKLGVAQVGGGKDSWHISTFQIYDT